MLELIKSKIWKSSDNIDVKKISISHVKSHLDQYNTKLFTNYRPYYVDMDILYIDNEFWESILPECRTEILSLIKQFDTPLNLDSIKLPLELDIFHTDNGISLVNRIAYTYTDSYDYDKWCFDLAKYLPQYDIHYMDVKTMSILLEASKSLSNPSNNGGKTEISKIKQQLPSLVTFIEISLIKHDKLFIKLGSMSGKRDISLYPLASVDDVLLFLISSKEFACEYQYRIKVYKSLSLISMKWNSSIETSMEYRVFVHDKVVTAISQQKFKIFHYLNDKIIKQHTKLIVSYVNTKISPLMKYKSAILDLWIDKEECKLIEINPWGEHSGTSSSLFHWINDLDKLYGKDHKINVRYLTN